MCSPGGPRRGAASEVSAWGTVREEEGGRGVKRRIIRVRIPPGHRHTVVAHQISADKRCPAFTASAAIECFLGCRVS